MTQYEQMDLLLEQNKGMIRTAQLLSLGITKTVFIIMLRNESWSRWLTASMRR
ncbi:MAG: hypothetical protein RSB37_05615 [Acetivibrio sp.]